MEIINFLMQYLVKNKSDMFPENPDDGRVHMTNDYRIHYFDGESWVMLDGDIYNENL